MATIPFTDLLRSDNAQGARRLRIVFVTACDLPEGIGGTSRLKSLVRALISDGHSVSILNEHGLGVAPVEFQKPIGTVSGAPYEYVLGKVERSYGFATIAAKCNAVATIRRRIRRLCEEGRIDLVWFNDLSLYDTYPLTLLAKHLGLPTVQSYDDERFVLVSQHKLSLAHRLFAVDAYLANRWCPAKADGVVVISSYLAEKYATLARDASKVHLIPTIIDCQLWQGGPEPIRETPVILYTGCLAEQDEMENILIALARLRDQGLGFRFIMLGGNFRKDEGGRAARIKTQISTLSLEGMVEQRGFVPHDQVRAEVAHANILINIRRDGVWSRSGLSTKLSEYLASGRLVVSSQLGDVGRYLKDGESALLVSGRCTADEITSALGRALSSAELRARIGAAGRQVALNWFDIPVAQSLLRNLLKNVLMRHSIQHTRRTARFGTAEVAQKQKHI
jgi:glycosyltransferase involved in cell wall biosynthesis